MKKFLSTIDTMDIELDLVDVGIFKLCLIITGIIITTVFPKTCKNLRPLLILVWMCLFSYLMLKMFVFPLIAQEYDLDI